MSDANPRVLYIDDDAQNLYVVQRILRRNGYEMIGAQSGEQGLELAEQDPPDAILLDILMPDMNGFEVNEALKAHPTLKDIPVVALTASLMHGDRAAGLAAGFVGFLSKPLTRLELINMLNRLTKDTD